MSEIENPPINLAPGEAHTADEDGAIIFTGKHTHADILRYVVGDIAEDALVLVNAAINAGKVRA